MTRVCFTDYIRCESTDGRNGGRVGRGWNKICHVGKCKLYGTLSRCIKLGMDGSWESGNKQRSSSPEPWESMKLMKDSDVILSSHA